MAKKVFTDESLATFVDEIKTYTLGLTSVKADLSHVHTKFDISDFPTIPTKTSELINDSGFKTYDNVEPMDLDIPMIFIDGNIPVTKEDTTATLTYISNTDKFYSYITIKCQGTSSMAYPKKNFTIKLYSDSPRQTKMKRLFRDWKFEESKFVLKANYIDHSHARNIIGARLWNEVVESRNDYDTLPEALKASPKHGAIDGFPVKVYTNGTYQGIYTWNIGKDAWMWNMDEDNENHVLLCAETNTNGVYAENACNFRALWNGVDGSDWSVEVGTNTESLITSVNNLITCIKDTNDEVFKDTIGNYLDVQSAIDYYLHQYVICGLDGLAKNMLLGTYDLTKWYCGAYDMDSTFGLWWDGTSFVSPDFACPDEYQERYNLLWERIASNFSNELRRRYAELRRSVYSLSNMFMHFERFISVINHELYDEDVLIYTGIPSANENNIQQIRNFIRDRLTYCDVALGLKDAIPATGITLNQNTLSFSDFTPLTLVATLEPSDTTNIVEWTSSDYNVATVNNGVVTPINNGTCIITAIAGNVSATCEVLISGLETKMWSDTATNSINNATGEVSTTNGDAYLSRLIRVPDDATLITLSNINGASYIWKELHAYDENQAYLGQKRDGGLVNATSISKTEFPSMKYIRATAYPNNVSTNNNPNNQLEFTADALSDGAAIPLENGTFTFNNGNTVTVTDGKHIRFNTVGNSFIALYSINDNSAAQNTFSGTGQYKESKLSIPKDSIIELTATISDATVNNGEMSIFMYPANSNASSNLIDNFILQPNITKTQMVKFAEDTELGSICAWLQNGGVVDFDLDIVLYTKSTIVIS